jgi:ankyrin repeat protein
VVKRIALGMLFVCLLSGSSWGDEALDKALIDAVTSGDNGQVRILLAKGADVDVKNGFLGWSAIRWAAQKGYADTVILLADHDADVNSRDKGGLTVLMSMAMNGRTDIVRMLVAKGADVNARTASGETALSYAVGNGHGDVIRILKEAGAK